MNRRQRRSTGIALTVVGLTIAALSTTGATAAPHSAPVTKYESYYVTGDNPADLAQHNQAALHAANPAAVPGVVPAGKDARINVPAPLPQAPPMSASRAATAPNGKPAPGTALPAAPPRKTATVQPHATTGTATTQAVPAQQGGDPWYNYCISAPGATSSAGAAAWKNFYCRVGFFLLRKVFVDSNGNQTVKGTINLRAVMYETPDSGACCGTAKTDRGAFGYLRYDEITTSGDYTNPDTILSADIQCVPNSGCVQTGAHGVGRTVADWQNSQSDMFSTWTIPNGSGTDLKGYGSVQIRAAATDGTVLAESYSPGNQLRCDSASYIARAQGCIIIGVVDELKFATDDPTLDESAWNIWRGWTDPDHTLPVVANKRVPGRGPEWQLYAGAPVTPSPLHRIFYDTTTRTANNNKAKNDCKYFWGTNYATSAGYARDCDEFPFASTREGAANANGNYVVKVITASDNQNAGRALKGFYDLHRILDGDMLYVGVYSHLPPSPTPQ